MLLVFSKERVVFGAREYLDKFDTSIINLPISIEIKYFGGVAPCGLALKIVEKDLEQIEVVLLKHNIEVKFIFEGGHDGQEYKKLR